ncbi:MULTISPECIES: hypothetical protein [unclassified Brevundimonas]|uniref:hypothetical protein n=1 Tax=unclassified Brevundimonas TaxID=2622653 RepID=UPI003F8EDAFE
MMIELVAAATLMTGFDPDGVVTTAPRGTQSVPTATAAMLAETTADASPSTTVQSAAPHGLSTDEQIARWVGDRTSDASIAPADPWAEAEPRKMHGEFSVGMGTGGYRDYSAAVSLPLGENGALNLSVRQTKNSPWGYGYGSLRDYPYGGYGRPFGVMEPPGYEGTYFRARPYPPLRSGAVQETTQSIGISLQTGR